MKAYIVVSCLFSISFVFGASGNTERRVSRDLDKVDGLRAQLLRLQKQIKNLESMDKNGESVEGSSSQAGDIRHRGSDIDEIRKLRGVTEAQMTSKQQQQMQELAKSLGDTGNTNLHALAATLTRLLKKKRPEEFIEEPHRYNSAGEYLGSKYNGYDRQEPEGRDSSDESHEEDGINSKRLQNIYNTLQRMYSNERDGKMALDLRSLLGGYQSDGDESEDRFPTANAQSSHARHPGEHRADVSDDHRSSSPFKAEEGMFGDFLDDSEDSFPTVNAPPSSHARHPGMRRAVLSAIETKLLDVIQDAQDAGFTVEDLIQDVQAKIDRSQGDKRLREIENELNDLTQART